MDWLEKYGDLDGDGFVEYLRRSPRGLVNQGWKDSWDANMHRDGKVAQPPIALVEVQGYVYDAKYRMASLLRAFGDTRRAEQLKKEATELARRFEKTYWMPQRGYYAMALDAEKKPLEVISSNPGHLLFTRMIGRERARAVSSRLMRDDMFSGWGWRTLSADEPVFNPLSYHRGSVWPHDNSIIAHGMSLQEFRDPAIRVLTTLFQAALEFRDYRLPELFCGVHHDRRSAQIAELAYPLQGPVYAAGYFADELFAPPEHIARGVHQLVGVGGMRKVVRRENERLREPAVPRFVLEARISSTLPGSCGWNLGR